VIALKVSEGLLLIATLVASLAEKLAVLLLGHTLATLLNNGTHEDLTKMDFGCET
jgi:2-polyprenyl-3-methyl-5-hydroxy-6-metoxy-1,4-benzoquinol methylase